MQEGGTTVAEAVALLNEINTADPTVLPALIGQRVICNARLAEHPTVQVGSTDDGRYDVGLLGVINGLFGANADGWGFIYAQVEDDGSIDHFGLTTDLSYRAAVEVGDG